jgi:hypothetical protein
MSRNAAAGVKGGFISVSGGRPLKLAQACEPLKSKTTQIQDNSNSRQWDEHSMELS